MTISVFSPPVGDLAVVPCWPHAGAPSNGTSGTLAGYAQKGDLLADTTGGTLYQNTGTQDSPTWTLFSAGGGTGFSGMTAGQVPVAASATTGTSSLPLSGSTTSAAEVVSASVAAKTSGHLATWDANGGLLDGGVVPVGNKAQHSTVIAGGAAGNHTVTGIATTSALVGVTYFVGAGTAVTDVVDLTSEFTISATNTINNAAGTDTTGGKLQVIWTQ